MLFGPHCIYKIFSDIDWPIDNQIFVLIKIRIQIVKLSTFDMCEAISFVVTTAAIGNPFPIPLAITTISGVTPCVSKPQ